MSIKLLPILLMALSVQHVLAFWSRPHDAYQAINDYLEKTIETPEVVANKRALSDWLNGNSVPKKIESELKTLEESLRGILDEPEKQCTDAATKKLIELNRATGGTAYGLPEEILSNRRIDLILHSAFRQHALYCQRVYPQLLLSTLSSLNRTQMRFVEQFMDPLFSPKSIISESPQRVSYFSHIGSIKTVANLPGAWAVVNLFREFSKMDPQLAKIVERDPKKGSLTSLEKRQVKKLIFDYVMQPCRYYTEKMSGFFKAVDFDLKQLKDFEIALTRGVYEGYVRERLCRKLVSDEYRTLTKKVIQYLNTLQRQKLEESIFHA